MEHTSKKQNVLHKNGDDFAACIYEAFPWEFFWQAKASDYVWAATLPEWGSIPSPYTSKAVIVAVESGDDKAGQWFSEERDYYKDCRQLFNEEPLDSEKWRS